MPNQADKVISRKAKVPVFLSKSINQVEDETLTDLDILAFDIETTIGSDDSLIEK